MASVDLYHALIWTSLVAGTLSTEKQTVCSTTIGSLNYTCRLGFIGTFASWRAIVCNIFTLLPPARVHIELIDFCSNVSTDSAHVSVEWRQKHNANSLLRVDNCSKVQASEGKDTRNHVRVEALLGKNESLDLTISVKRPVGIHLLARASSGAVSFYCLHSVKTPVQDGTTEGIQSTEEITTYMTEIKTTTVSSKDVSTVTLTASILASVVIVAVLGLALLYAWKGKCSGSPPSDSASHAVEDPGQREATPDNAPDATDYDLLGRFRKPEGASVDPTYGHLEPEEGDYSHVQRGPSKRPMVIKGDNLYGHLTTVDE